MRQAVNLRPTPGSARNLAIMEEATGDVRGRDEALRILRELQESPAP
jgi:hypothetical protein